MKCPPFQTLIAAALLVRCASAAPLAQLATDEIGKAAGVTPTTSPDGVVRIAWARNDVVVKVDGAPIKPFAGLGSWAAFTPTEHGAMFMGDTVVFQDEVDAAMDAAFGKGLKVTAIHNHFFYDEPKVFFMHIGGEGNAVDLAEGVKAVWDAIKAVRAKAPAPATGFPGAPIEAGQVDAKPLEDILGSKPAAQDGIVKFTIGREGQMMGVRVAGSMGLATWMAFSGTNENAAIDGDFIMSAEEVQTVLHALRAKGIHLVALHNHMVGETPSFFFTHFWAKGPAAELAKSLKSVLDAQAALAKTK